MERKWPWRKTYLNSNLALSTFFLCDLGFSLNFFKPPFFLSVQKGKKSLLQKVVARIK
jgi:hypothetical protein